MNNKKINLFIIIFNKNIIEINKIAIWLIIVERIVTLIITIIVMDQSLMIMKKKNLTEIKCPNFLNKCLFKTKLIKR